MIFDTTYASNGDITIKFNIQQEKLYSPDGSKHAIPCDGCGVLQWVSLPSVAVMCDTCVANSDQEERESFAAQQKTLEVQAMPLNDACEALNK